MLSRTLRAPLRLRAPSALRPLSLRAAPRATPTPITAVPRASPLALQLQHHLHLQTRLASTSTPPPKDKDAKDKPAKESGLKISHLFAGLVSLGLLVTIYGLLEFYYSLQIWPEPVRGPLKSAIKAKTRGETERADAFFRLAVHAARSLPPSALAPDPLLKLSGIYVTWGAMLEAAGQPVRAYDTIREAMAFFGDNPLAPDARTSVSDDAWSGGPQRPLTTEEHHRAIGLAQKLGQIAGRMAEMRHPPPFPDFLQEAVSTAVPPPKTDTPVPTRRGRDERETEAPEEAPAAPQVYIAPVPAGLGTDARTWNDAAEVYLTGALTAMLRIGLGGRTPDGAVVAGRDLALPQDGARTPDGEEDTAGRVNRRGLGMTMEALSTVYARQKRPDLAAQLLLQALSTVLPPAGEHTLEDRCNAANLMTGIASYTLEPRTPDAVRVARTWALKARELADGAAAEAGWTGPPAGPEHALCVRAQAAAAYNLGMLDEIENNLPGAAEHFATALSIAREGNYPEGRRRASDALRRVRPQVDPKEVAWSG